MKVVLDKMAVKVVLDTMETYGIVLEQDAQAVAIDVSIDYTIRGTINVAIDLDEPMEPLHDDLIDFATSCDNLINEAIEEQFRYGDMQVDYDSFEIQEAIDQDGNGLDIRY